MSAHCCRVSTVTRYSFAQFTYEFGDHPFFATTPFSHNPFGLYCGVWVIDWLSRQGYKVSVMAPRER